MIDSHFRSFWQVWLFEPLAHLLWRLKLRPNHVTLLAIVSGIIAAIFLMLGQKWLALSFLLASGVLDATDGTLARKTRSASDTGSILDIAGDRIVEASIVLGLYLYEPTTRGLPSLLLIASFYLCVTTFLLSGIFEKNRGEKSFHYSPGIIERAETFIFFSVVIVWEQAFFVGAIMFSGLVFLTAFMRLSEMLAALSPKNNTTLVPQTLDASDRSTMPKADLRKE